MATVRGTVSEEISEGLSRILGVRHRMCVLLRYEAGAEPNLPNLHLRPYYSNYSPSGGGVVCQNKAESEAETTTSASLPTLSSFGEADSSCGCLYILYFYPPLVYGK